MNGAQGITYGIEAWGTLQVTPAWRLRLGGTTLWKNIHPKPGHVDLAPRNLLGGDPNWQVIARSEYTLTPRLEFDLDARAVGDVDDAPQLGSYAELGGRLAYRLNDSIDLFVTGRNLLHQTHQESNDPGTAQLAKRTLSIGARAHF